MENSTAPEMLEYKGRPLIRSGNSIYLGDMSEKFVAMLQILSNEGFNDMEMANKITVQLISTDVELRPRDRIVKKSEKNNLYEAIDIASIWLDRALDPTKTN